MAERQLTQEYVRSLFEYDPETGVLTWKERPREHFKTKSAWCSVNARFAGKPAGFEDLAHLRVLIDGKTYYLHRVIWLWMTGEHPDTIDHINGVGSDNRWVNIRDVIQSENMRNMRRSKLNTSGVTGVSWNKAVEKWIAYITTDRKRHFLGYFGSLEAAIDARKMAQRDLGFHENHGN
jgi:hypothetical protein